MESEEEILREQEIQEELALRKESVDSNSAADAASRLRRKWKKILAVELVNGWHQDSPMWRVADRAWQAIGKEPADEKEKFGGLAAIMNIRFFDARLSAKVFIAKHFYSLNEGLWGGRRTDACVLLAERALGLRKGMGAALFKPAREGDKSRDWATVK